MNCCMCGGTLETGWSSIRGDPPALADHMPLAFACWACWRPLPSGVKAAFYSRAATGIEGALAMLTRYAEKERSRAAAAAAGGA